MKAKNSENQGGERSHEHGHEHDELARAREILERTMRFLARCSDDPEAAVKAEDPRELIRGLRELAMPLPPVEEQPKELPSIPIRKRRSA
jgi:hypothetical protein